jgi:ATP synthase protein I
MTTSAPLKKAPRVLRSAALWVLGATVVLIAAGTLAGGRPAALGALVGGAMVLVFFGFGATFVGLAARWAPQSALLVALLTYTFQVVLVALVFVALRESGVLETDISAEWLAAGLIGGTFAWMGGQVVATLRTPIEPFERSVPAEEVGAK